MVVSRRAFVGGMLLLPVVIAACGEETPPPDTAAASAGKPLPAEAWRAFADELHQRAAAGAFSGAVLVANDGKPLLEQGYGMADRQRGLANTAQTKFPIASLGKMFTGVAIAQLVEQDKLSFTDTIEKYALGFPPEIAGTVTIHEVQVGNPSGGAWSTVGDLLKFAQALTGHRLLSPGMTDAVVAGKAATNRPGPGQDKYAYGFSDQRINGARIVGHNGGSPGYEGQLDIYPDRGDVVVILTNQDQVLTPAIQRSQAILTRPP